MKKDTKKGYGLPYKGSKRKIAKDIVDVIIKDNPSIKYFYDLFGGGGAVSIEMARRGIKVFYNDANNAISNAFEYAVKKGFTMDDIRWVDRVGFFKRLDSNQPLHGLEVLLFSFSNDQSSYCYSKILEPIMKLLHYVCVDDCIESKKTLDMLLKTELQTLKLDDSGIFDRVGVVTKSLKKKGYRYDLSHISRMKQAIRLKDVVPHNLLVCTSLDYKSVQIPFLSDDVVIYLDPPYQDTNKYQIDVSHDELKKFMSQSRFKIYLSEYQSDFKQVWSKEKQVTNGLNNRLFKVESLFVNES